MTFNNGKFYNDFGQVVPLEHGNKQQVKLLNQIESLREGVLFSAYNRFTCPCGSQTNRLFSDGEGFTCKVCGFKYEYYTYDGLPCIRLKI
jgi:hypothetical protein